MSGKTGFGSAAGGANRGIVAVARWLPAITRLRLRSHSGPDSRCGWNGHGEGRVKVDRDVDGSLIFHESGQFTLTTAQAGTQGATRRAPAPLNFRNVLRWIIHGDRIALAHQRFGADAEVALVELIPAGPVPLEPVPLETLADADLVSSAPHLCGHDRYHARLRLTGHGFDLTWRITGPAKDETLVHAYRS